LYFGSVDAKVESLGLGIGEHVGQGMQPCTGPLRDGKATPGQQRTDLVDCTGNGGPGHSVQLGQRRMRQLQPQVDQGDQHPVDEYQLVIGPGTGRPLTVVAAPFLERRLALCRPRRARGGLRGPAFRPAAGAEGSRRAAVRRRRPCELDERLARQATALHTAAPAVGGLPRRGPGRWHIVLPPIRLSKAWVQPRRRRGRPTTQAHGPAQDAGQHRSRGVPLVVSYGLGRRGAGPDSWPSQPEGPAGRGGRHESLNLRGRRDVTADPALSRTESLTSKTPVYLDTAEYRLVSADAWCRAGSASTGRLVSPSWSDRCALPVLLHRAFADGRPARSRGTDGAP
jgi:hypothetical protein